MNIKVEHRPSYALGIVELDGGEDVKAETGEFSGSGSVWLQTRSNQAFLDWLVPRLTTASTSSGDRDDVGGVIGNILRGS